MFPIHRCSSPFLFFILYFVFYVVHSVLIAINAITTIDPRLDLKFRGSRSKLSIVGWLETNPPPLPTIAPVAKEIQINLHRNILLRPWNYTFEQKMLSSFTIVPFLKMRCNHQIKTDFFPSFQTNHHYCHPHHCNNTAKLHCDSKCIVMRGNGGQRGSRVPSYIQAVFIDRGDVDDVDFHRGIDRLDF